MPSQTVTRALSRLGLDRRGTDPHLPQPAPMLLQKADAMFSSADSTYDPNGISLATAGRLKDEKTGGWPMNFVRAYDILTQAREKLFGWTRPLGQTQYTQSFPFGLRTLRATMIEIARVEHFYGKRLREEPLPAFDDYPISETRQPTFADLERVWTPLAGETRATLARTTDWDRTVTRRIEQPDKIIVSTATKADLAMQLLFHEVHHRAQAMAMLRQLGVEAQNLDYLTFAAKREEFPKDAASRG